MFGGDGEDWMWKDAHERDMKVCALGPVVVTIFNSLALSHPARLSATAGLGTAQVLPAWRL